MKAHIYSILYSTLLWSASEGFAPSSSSRPMQRTTTCERLNPLFDRKWEDRIDEGSRRNIQGSGAGETVTGAVLGGLLLGPFGALFGASVGSNIGAKNAINKARKQEMERLGITQDMLDAAKDVGIALEESMEGLKATKDSLQTQQSLARRLDREYNELYDKAKKAIAQNNEDEARRLLLERTRVEDKLKQALKYCAEEKKRLERMEDNVSKIEERAMEIDSLLRRSVGSKAVQQAESYGLALQDQDPLLQKFKDLGID